jgi:hypothetical protein
MRTGTLLALSLAAGLAGPAFAQTGALFSIGADAVFHDPVRGLDNAFRVAPLVRVRFAPGLGPAASIGGFRAGFPDGEGRLRMRTLMAGPAYSLERRRITASVALLAGYAFSKLEAGAPGQRLRGSHAFQPTVGVWYDLSEKLGVRASVGYLMARLPLTVDGPGGPRSTRVRADALVLRLGVAYAVF